MFLKNYEYFLAIAEERSISKAAARLFISQPSLSKYLKKLEENTGTELFERNSYPLKLSPAGELYMEYVQDFIKRNKKLQRDLSDIENSPRGKVTLGITVWRSSILLPTVFSDFKREYPNINIELQEGSQQYIFSLLEQDKVDFCIFHSPNTYHNFTFEHLAYEHILFAVNRDNPLLSKLHYDINKQINTMTNQDFLQFKEEPFFMLKEGQYMRRISQNFLNKLDISNSTALETSNIVTALNLVSAGAGVTFVPEAILNSEEYAKNLTFFKIDTPPLQWEIVIGYKTGAILSRQALLFIEAIKKAYNNINT